MTRQDIKALIRLSREDLSIRQGINPVKRINYRALCDMMIIDLKDILSCYHKDNHLTVSLSYLKTYGKCLSDSYKGYILFNCKVLG